MQKSEIEVGEEYALRELRKPKEPMQHVKVLQKVRGKQWKVEWIEPNPGLIDYVKSRDLLVRWKDRKAFLRDEEQERQLRADNDRNGYEEDSPIDNALSSIIDRVGENHLSFYKGVLSGPHEAIERVRERAEFDATKRSPFGYVDRHGTAHVPFAEALELAKMFCAAEPSTILVGIEAREREWAQKASKPGGEYLVRLLNEYQAAWALIRQWTGHDAAVAEREAQIRRLERLVWDAIYALQKAGADEEAGRLRRAVQRE